MQLIVSGSRSYVPLVQLLLEEDQIHTLPSSIRISQRSLRLRHVDFTPRHQKTLQRKGTFGERWKIFRGKPSCAKNISTEDKTPSRSLLNFNVSAANPAFNATCWYLSICFVYQPFNLLAISQIALCSYFLLWFFIGSTSNQLESLLLFSSTSSILLNTGLFGDEVLQQFGRIQNPQISYEPVLQSQNSAISQRRTWLVSKFNSGNWRFCLD